MNMNDLLWLRVRFFNWLNQKLYGRNLRIYDVYKASLLPKVDLEKENKELREENQALRERITKLEEELDK
jgi:cell division protein FtsB